MSLSRIEMAFDGVDEALPFSLMAGVTVRSIVGRGRGLFTDSAIAAGSVVLAEPAVSARGARDHYSLKH